VTAGQHATRLCIELAADSRAPERARAWLHAVPMPSALQHDALLIVSELVTNSVRHAGLAAHQLITVAVERTDEAVRIEVHDPGPGIRPESIDPPDPWCRGGRGLYLVERLSARWGAQRGAGGLVWAELRA
jgi:anti-sigma regulatory factor (Ser/Thr protein kinase)